MYQGRWMNVALIVVLGLIGLTGSISAKAAPKEGKLVKFEGKLINLAEHWGEAQACAIWDQADASECFRTIAELDQHVSAVTRAQQKLIETSDIRTMVACSSPLQLFENTNFNLNVSGRVLRFYDRNIWQNLSDFNDQMSSYKTGACSANLAENSNGGGLFYPGNTNAFVNSSCMCAGSTGWNDRVSSIRVN